MAEELDPLTGRLQDMMDATDAAQTDLSGCLATARAYLDAGCPAWTAAPQPVQDDVALAVAADLWQQKNARLGVMSIDTTDGVQPYRVPLDPLRAAWPKLRAAGILVGLGIA